MSEYLCSLCHTPMTGDEPSSSCPECRSHYHDGCFEENGGCGTYACGHAPAQEKQAAPFQVPTVWGADTKQCPLCSHEIRAAALRCRHCGARFPDATPIDAAEYEGQLKKGKVVEDIRRSANTIFFTGMVPCFAPIVLVFAGGFLLNRREALASVPPFTRLMVYLGLGLSVMWIVLAGLVFLLS